MDLAIGRLFQLYKTCEFHLNAINEKYISTTIMSTKNPVTRPSTLSPSSSNNGSSTSDLSFEVVVGIIVGSSVFICCITFYIFYLKIKYGGNSKLKTQASSKSMKESHEYIYRESLLNENDQRYGRSSLLNSKRSSLNADRSSVELGLNRISAALKLPSPSAQRSEIGVDQVIDYGRESMEAQHNRYDDEGIGSLTVMVVKKGDRIEVVDEQDMTSRDSILGSTITDKAPTPLNSCGNSLEDRILSDQPNANPNPNVNTKSSSSQTMHKGEEQPSGAMYNMEISREDMANRYSINGPKMTETTKDSKNERLSQRETEVLFAYNPATTAAVTAPKLENMPSSKSVDEYKY